MLSSVKRYSKLLGFLFIIGILTTNPMAFAKTPAKPGNPGLPGCLAEVEELTGQLTQCQEDLLLCHDQGDGQSFPAPVATTGQITPHADGDDGSLQKGVSLGSAERFADNQNGTLTDNLTGLVWTKNANLFGTKTWSEALISCNTLGNSQFDLTDDSQSGQWRLPNIRELLTLVDYAQQNPALPAGHPFIFGNLEIFLYWSSTTYVSTTYTNGTFAWFLYLNEGSISPWASKSTDQYYVWCVRDAS